MNEKTMNIVMLEVNRQKVAEVLSDEVVVNTTQDALDLLASSSYQEADCILLYEKNLLPDFFDLKTGVAGEILQKYTNYKMKLVIVGDFEKFTSNALKAFILESNRHTQVGFVATREAALEKIAGW